MRKTLLLFVLAIPDFGAPQKPQKAETPHLAFVTEYIRELAAVEDIRSSGEKELKQGQKDDVFSTAVYTSTRMQLELRADVKMLNDMHLKDPFDFLIPSITSL